MKKQKILLVAVFLAINLFFSGFAAFAAEVTRGILTVSPAWVRAGDQVEVTFTLENSQDLAEGLNALQGTLEYNKEVFAEVDSQDFTTCEGWENLYYNPENGSLVVINKAGDRDGGEVFRLRLTARAQLTPGETAVQFSDVALSDGQEELNPQQATVSVEVISDPASSGGQETPEQQPPAGGSGGSAQQPSAGGSASSVQQPSASSSGSSAQQPSAGSSASSAQQPSASSSASSAQQPAGEIPAQQGGKIGFILAAVFFALCLLLVLFGFRRGWLGKKIFRALAALLVVALIAVIFAGVAYGLQGKGDLNEDGAVDYADVDLLARHLVGLQQLEEHRQLAADMNSDGRLTVTDLALLIRAVEKTVHYQVQLFSAVENRYLEKGQTVQLPFQAQVTYDAAITAATVNGETLPVERAEDGSSYFITLHTGDKAGLLPFHFTEVSLAGGQTVPVDFTETLEVLKDIPTVENFVTEELTDSVQLQAKFLVNDPDGAFASGWLELTQTAGDSRSAVAEQQLTAGWNEVVLDLPEGQEGQLSICISYDRTTGELADDAQAYAGTVNIQKDLLFRYEYGFVFAELQSLDDSLQPTDIFGKNQPVTLRFRSENRSAFVPERVTVNGADYPAASTEEAGIYLVTLPGFAQSGEQQIRLEQVVLSNGKVFPLENQQLTVQVLKTMPAVSDLAVQELEAGKSLRVSFAVSDPDSALSNRKVTVKDAAGQTLLEVPFTEDQFDRTLPLSGAMTASYTVAVAADCDISADGSAQQPGKLLAENTIQAQLRAEAADLTADKTHYEKGEQAILSVSLATNAASPVEKLVVNSLDLPAAQTADGRWQVSLPAPSQAGGQTLRLTQVVFADGTILPAQAQVEVQVLRDLPVVESYQAQDDFEKDQVNFTFVIQDPDGALVSAEASLTADDGSEAPAQQQFTAAGQQTCSFSVQEDKPYTFTITLTSRRSADSAETVTELALTRPIQMIRDYQLTVSDFSSARQDGTPSLYFEKGEPVLLCFQSHNQTRFVPLALVSGETEYPLTDAGSGQYTLLLSGSSQAGAAQFSADALRMNNGKLLPIAGGRQLRYEVLKDAPAVEGFATRTTDQDELLVQFDLADADGALQSARVKITDELGSLLLDEPVSAGPNEKKVGLSIGEKYTVEVLATYDRDTNALGEDANLYTNVSLFAREVTASREGIELKDVETETLYLYTEGGSQKVDFLDISQGIPAAENYYAVIQMKDLPDFYAGVREFRLDQNTQKLYAVLDQDNLISYASDGSKSSSYAFPVAYRDSQGDHPLMASAQTLFQQMAQNLNGTFELTCDLDASGIGSGSYAIPGTFSGTLKGNGYTIYNLPAGLFQKLSGATITDLVLEDAQITAAHNGILAGSIEKQSLVEKVFLVDCSVRNSTNMTGGFAGSLTNSTIRQSAAINLTIRADNTIGGLVGQTNAGSVVEDCYVTGQLQGTRNNNLGARVGGISGWHSGSVIQRCLTKVNIAAPKNTGNGGIIGGPNSATSSRISHCVSLGGGTAYRIAGFTAALSSAQEVYEYAGSNSTTNRTEENAENIREIDALSRAFLTDTLGLDAKIWNMDLVDGGRLPSLQADPLPKNEADYAIVENALNIPNYRRVRGQAAYRADRDIAYANLAKLLPFADTADWVAYGNSLPAESLLVSRQIQYILPLGEANSLVSGLEAQNPAAVQSVRLVFTDGSAQTLSAAYRKTLGNILAVYRLDAASLGAGELPYQFRGYVKDLEGLPLADLAQTAAALDYQNDIASLTSETESRLYVDYYQQSVQPVLESVVRDLVLSQAQFPAYTRSAAVDSLVQQRLADTQALRQYLYAYNYYDKWYNFGFDGVALSDLLFFSGDLLTPDLSAGQLTDQLLQASSDLRGTGRTYDYYTQILQPHTGMEMMDFLARLAKGAGYDDPSDWFAAEFDGILVEQKPDTLREGINYRIWHLLSTLGGRRQIILPILSAPQEDMYLLAIPSQLIVGSMNRYDTYANKDGGERDRMRAFIETTAERYSHFYGISANWITRAPEILNSFVNIQYDTRFNFPPNPVTNSGEQVRGVTQDPVIKWVYEAVGAYSDMGGVGAYANGTDVYCVAYPAIGSTFTFYALTHETAHNQDGRYFYAGYGRRGGTGPEAHADGNIAQQIEDGSMVFNISRICDPASDVTNNLSYKRIETADQVWDYYAEMFETSYVLDYLAGQAFLQLTPEEQARVAIQVSHVQQGNSVRSIYSRLTADDFRAMDLQNMADLWDNKIALKAPGDRASAAGAYGYESFYDVNWYQPHFDEGSPDSSSFKRLGQEMLGVGGYEGGYVTYISAKSSSDLQALRTITGDSDITWRDYKLGRYAAVEAKLDQIPFFDPQQVIEQFKAAFRQDNDKRDSSIALQRTLYGIVKRATGDFVTGSIYQEETPIRITTAAQLVQAVQQNPMGYYLLENDLDFTGLSADQGAYISAPFIGTLDGGGHSLTGLSHTLFKEMVYGQVINLTLESPAYAADAAAYLALSTKNVVLSNLQVANADLNLPLVKQKSGGYYELGGVSVTIGQKTISTPEELLAIAASETARKMDYVLEADLDFQGIALDAAAVSGTFSGKLDGAGHRILHLSAPLFESVDGAQIRNLTLEGASLTQDRYKGLLANKITGSSLENIRIAGSVLANNSNQVGMLAGLVRSSNLSRISLENITVSANNTVGGLAGQIDGTTVENCLVTGAVQGVLNNSLGSRAGGITGWLSSDAVLNNCYVKAQISGAKPAGNGGFIGGPNTGSATIRNSVSLSTGANAYRISGFPVLGNAENLYELESSDSLTNQTDSNTDRVKLVGEEQAREPVFYTDSLGWSEEIWDLSQLAAGGAPQLR